LRHVGQEPEKPAAKLAKAQRTRLERSLRDYLANGGFPEAQGLDLRNRVELLRTYVDVVLLRDVIERHNVSQPQVLRWMAGQLLGNPAGAFSINRFHGDLKSRGVSVSKETLHANLAHLEDAFLLRSVAIATDSERRRQVNPRKVYPVDTGLMALFVGAGKGNVGHAMETAVLHELGRRGAEVGYVRTPDGFEVDFLARGPSGGEMLVQVCANLDDEETLARALRALRDAAAIHPRADRLLIALESPVGVKIPAGIELVSAVDWLLG